MAYYVKFKGFRGRAVRRERETKAEAVALFEYLARHNIPAKMGLIRADGSLVKPSKEHVA